MNNVKPNRGFDLPRPSLRPSKHSVLEVITSGCRSEVGGVRVYYRVVFVDKTRAPHSISKKDDDDDDDDDYDDDDDNDDDDYDDDDIDTDTDIFGGGWNSLFSLFLFKEALLKRYDLKLNDAKM